MSSNSWSDFSAKVKGKSKITDEKDKRINFKSNLSKPGSFLDLKASLKKSGKDEKDELLGKREKVRRKKKSMKIYFQLIYNSFL